MIVRINYDTNPASMFIIAANGYEHTILEMAHKNDTCLSVEIRIGSSIQEYGKIPFPVSKNKEAGKA